MPIKGVICNVVQCNARVFMAMVVVVVVARHEQARSQAACEVSGQGINVESEKRGSQM